MNVVYRYIECKDILTLACKEVMIYKYKNKKVRRDIK